MGLGFGILGLGFWVQGLGIRVWGSRFRRYCFGPGLRLHCLGLGACAAGFGVTKSTHPQVVTTTSVTNGNHVRLC